MLKALSAMFLGAPLVLPLGSPVRDLVAAHPWAAARALAVALAFAPISACSGGHASASPTPGQSLTSTASDGTSGTSNQDADGSEGRPAPSKTLVETARSADAFVDSIGVNTHLNYNATAYWTRFERFKKLLADAGIRHIRDSLLDPSTAFANYIPELNELAAVGVRANFYVLPNELGLPGTAQFLQTFPSKVGPIFESYEAPNEQDLTGGPNWVANARTFQQQIWKAVKGSPASSAFPVIGPSLTRNTAYAAVGDLSEYLDAGNMHDYLYGENPETTGAGLGGFGDWWGSIPFDITSTGQVSGTKPVWATETGYCTNPTVKSFNNVGEDTQAAYLPRLFLQSFRLGVKRTIAYEFIDDGIGNDFGYCGLVTATLQEKPAYRIVRHMTRLLADPGPAFPLGSLKYRLAGGAENVAHVLLQKRDGTFFLVLWDAQPEWYSEHVEGANPSHKVDVAPLRIVLHVESKVERASIHRFDAAGRTQDEPLTFVDGETTLQIGPVPQIVEMHA